MDCGPTCLHMIAKYYGKSYTLQGLRERSFITSEGVLMLGISDAAESIGFRTTGVKIGFEQLTVEAPLTCILHWNQIHFVVLYKIKNNKYHIANPASKKVVFDEDEYKRCWILLHVNTRINISHISDFLAKIMRLPIRFFDTKMIQAVTVANIRDFIDSLPLGYNTKIGMERNGVSQGQRQRMLIARAVYKNPEFIFLDKDTNALDTKNEKDIMEHLNEFYIGKTVVVVAHSLSTVKDADNIIVLDNGKVAEEGTHKELTAKLGIYYQLVKN